MKKRLAFILLAALVHICAIAQSEREAAENIKHRTGIRYGEGRGLTQYDAEQNARNELAHSISAVVSINERHGIDTRTGNSDQFYSMTSTVTSNVTLQNVEFITWQEGNDYLSVAFISEKDLKEAVEDRKSRVRDLISLGLSQEANVNIAGALKYYCWALNMANYFKDDIKYMQEGVELDARLWLPEKIKSVLNNIKITLDGNEIIYNPDDYDKYAVNLKILYNGYPVSGLDLSYFNGDKTVYPVHAKSGEATLLFTNLNTKSISVKALYNYLDEAANYHPEIKLSYEKGPTYTFDTFSTTIIPVSVNENKVEIKQTKLTEVAGNSDSKTGLVESLSQVETVETNEVAVPVETLVPIEANVRKTIERKDAAESFPKLVSAMQQVEQAIKSRNYESVKNLFTNEGFSLFMLMMRSGKVSVVKKSEFKVEKSNLFTIGQKIPVVVKVGKHSSNENIVFRFDDNGLISSVAYALTKIAEDDIFRQASWNLESRYSLLTFMEDYQTAFALKRLDYMEKIFSDNAIIIVGKFDSRRPLRGSGFTDNGTKNLKVPATVSYKYFNKDQYLNKLEKDFSTKSFIQLVFEDTEISKASTNGMLDNEVIWIELKQQYISNNYADKGFLTLQINMKPSGSQINIRTWTPTQVSLDEMKERYNFERK